MMNLRSYPQFSLCGLNCSLCPRYNTTSPSRCPGCGARGFFQQHPSCAILTCNDKKDNVAFCFECKHYPCQRYRVDDKDSFITYLNRRRDIKHAQHDLEGYLRNLKEKSEILCYLLEHHNDGKSKNFFCLAVNLLDLEDLREVKNSLNEAMGTKEVRNRLLEAGQKRGISIALRK